VLRALAFETEGHVQLGVKLERQKAALIIALNTDTL
jgi:hypothetical protein